MAKMGSVENGLRRRRKSRRKRNPVAATAKPRRSVSLATAKNVLKKNGLKAISSKANPRHKRRKRRNGIQAAPRARNGFFGNTKSDVKNVAALGGGAMFVKVAGRFITPWMQKLLAQVGMEKFAEIITDAGLSLTLVPMIAGKLGGKNASDMSRLGGLLVVGLDVVELVAPDALSNINPFSTSPVVLANGQALLTPGTAANIARQAADETAAKVAGVMNQIQAGAAFDGAGGMQSAYLPPLGVY